MHKKNLHKIISGLLTFLISVSFFVSTPIQACACGMLVAEGGKDIAMKGERGIVIYDSEEKEEQLIIDFQLSGSSNSSALVVPTPVKAEITQVKKEVFDQLEDMINPRPLMDNAPASLSVGSSKKVEVLERKTVGRFDIAALKANKYEDLFAWTEENGFKLQEEAESPVRSFIDADFVLNVIKLKKNSKESDINPLKFTFNAEKYFYPLMEVNDERDSEKDKSLELYILSDKRISLKSLDVDNKLVTSEDLEYYVIPTEEKDFDNLNFSSDSYYGSYLETSNYGSSNIAEALGNPVMKEYAPLGLNYENNKFGNINYLIASIVLLSFGGLLIALYYANRLKKKKQL